MIQLLFTTVQNDSPKAKKTCIIIKTKSLHILFTLIFVQLDDYSLSINGNRTPTNLQGHVMKSIFKNIYFSLLKPWNGQYVQGFSHRNVCCVACFWECMDPRHKHFLWLSRAPRRPLWSLLDALLICSCVFGRHPRASFFILNFNFTNALNVFTLWINSHGVFRLFLVLGVKVHIAGYIFYFKLIYNLVWK